MEEKSRVQWECIVWDLQERLREARRERNAFAILAVLEGVILLLLFIGLASS